MSAECPPRRLLTGCPVLPNIPSQADSCARSFIHVNRKAQKAEHNGTVLFNRLAATDINTPTRLSEPGSSGTVSWIRVPNRTGSFLCTSCPLRHHLHNNRKSEVFTCGTGASFCLDHAHLTF